MVVSNSCNAVVLTDSGALVWMLLWMDSQSAIVSRYSLMICWIIWLVVDEEEAEAEEKEEEEVMSFKQQDTHNQANVKKEKKY